MTVFRLPLPPSNNDLVRPAFMEDLKCRFCGNRPSKRPLVRLVATGEAKEYRAEAHRRLPVSPVGGVVELYVTVFVPTIASDGLNRIKALEDAITERLWFDDKQISEWHVKRVVTSDESKHGVVVEVRPVDPSDVDHHEAARRLATSSIQRRANEAVQVSLGAWANGRSTPPAPVRPREVLPEPLQQRLSRLARPAVVTNRNPDDEGPKGAK